MLEEGTGAPSFSLPDQSGETISLEDLRGSWTVLYFYPKADTPGCTAQACAIRDRSAEYEQRGVRIIGASPDTVEEQRTFADKHGLTFSLLADADHRLADEFGVWGKKKMYGHEFYGVSRSTFIIDPEGNLARVFPKVSPKTHDDVILSALDELQGVSA